MDYNPIVAKHAQDFGLEPELVHAIIMTESKGKIWSYRFEPNYPYVLSEEISHRLAIHNVESFDTEMSGQRHSWGLMHVMGATARSLGMTDPLCKLLDPDTGIFYGCKELSRLLKRYNLKDAIASYNSGSPKFISQGVYKNQAYVDETLTYYNNYKATGVFK